MPKQLDNGVLILSKAVHDPDTVLEKLQELDWIRHPSVPRSEYYYNLDGKPYSYGKPPYDRTYQSQPHEPMALHLLHVIAEQVAHVDYDTCFLNRYLNSNDSLQWHSDDSPEMDPNKPIVILSLGAEREIWFRPKVVWTGYASSKEPEVTKIKLPNGSACIMPAGFQQTHQHRIPKGDRPMDERISLTYRGYING